LRTQAQFRLLVVRLGAMGDILHALPAVTALRKAHPAWMIGWAVEPRWRPLLMAEAPDEDLDEDLDEETAGELGERIGASSEKRSRAMPVVDRIHLAPTKAWGRKPLSRATWDAVRALRAELKSVEYDAVLDLQGAIRSAVLGRLTGCRRVIGDDAPWEKPARWLYTERVETVGPHVIQQNVELADAVAGDVLLGGAPWLPVHPGAERWCDEVPELEIAEETERPVVLVHPGGGWGAKRWPAERYGAVVEELARRGALVLVNAGPGEDELAAAVLAWANGHGRTVACSLEQLMALTRRVSLVIGGDTGPLHLASAMGRPVVGIYGPTDPKRNGPYGGHFRVLRNPESRRDHTRREQTEAGLLTILPKSVMEAAMGLLLEERV
jgi:heptosyltransferase I